MLFRDQVIFELVEWVDSNIESIRSLDVVYDRAGYSAGHLRALFKQVTGMSLYEYITVKRISLSLHDIHRGELTIAAIASKYHFSSTQGFARAFKKIHLCTPATYKKTNIVQRNEIL